MIKHNYKERNRVADLLAKGAKKEVFGRLAMLLVPPVFVNETFWTDILGTIFPKHVLKCNSNSLHTLAQALFVCT